MKKVYQTPEVLIVGVAIHAHILEASGGLQSISSNAEVSYGGSSSEAARVKESDYNVWEDDWSE